MRPIFGLVMLAIAGVGIGTAQQSSIKDIGPVTVIDSTKKEGVLKKCSITLGTRRYNLPETKGERAKRARRSILPRPARTTSSFVRTIPPISWRASSHWCRSRVFASSNTIWKTGPCS